MTSGLFGATLTGTVIFNPGQSDAPDLTQVRITAPSTDLSAFGSDSLVGATKSRGGFLAVAYDWRVQTSAGEQVLAGLRRPTNMAPSRRR